MNSDAVRPDKHLSHFLDKTRIALIAGLLISLVSISNVVAQETKMFQIGSPCGATLQTNQTPRASSTPLPADQKTRGRA
jgi:hypothetical protein